MRKKLIVSFLLITLLLVIAYILIINIPICAKKKGLHYYSTVSADYVFKDKDAIIEYCSDNGFNTNYCIFVDYSIKSGSPRFFIYDFTKKDIVFSCLCAHGLGGGSTAITPVFSNSEGSLCSSLGRFVITGIGSATYKNCFRLKGLDPVNNNAATRGILIHAGRMVSYHKLIPYIPLSKTCEGCLTITKKGLFKLHELYRQEKNKQILVYTFNDNHSQGIFKDS